MSRLNSNTNFVIDKLVYRFESRFNARIDFEGVRLRSMQEAEAYVLDAFLPNYENPGETFPRIIFPEEEEEELDNEDKELMKEAGDWKGAFKSDKGSKPYKPTPELQKAKTTVREEWESKFENVKSACSTNKAKGG